MIAKVREILSRIGPNGLKRLAEWHVQPDSRSWFVDGLTQRLGEEYRAAASWIATVLESDRELPRCLAEGLANNKGLTIKLFLAGVSERELTRDDNLAQTVAETKLEVRQLHARLTALEALIRNGNTRATTNAAKTIKLQILKQVAKPTKKELQTVGKMARALMGMPEDAILNAVDDAINGREGGPCYFGTLRAKGD